MKEILRFIMIKRFSPVAQSVWRVIKYKKVNRFRRKPCKDELDIDDRHKNKTLASSGTNVKKDTCISVTHRRRCLLLLQSEMLLSKKICLGVDRRISSGSAVVRWWW